MGHFDEFEEINEFSEQLDGCIKPFMFWFIFWVFLITIAIIFLWES